MKLFLQKNAEFSSFEGSAPRSPLASGGLMLHHPPTQPPNCDFVATRLRNTVVRFRTKKCVDLIEHQVKCLLECSLITLLVTVC